MKKNIFIILVILIIIILLFSQKITKINNENLEHSKNIESDSKKYHYEKDNLSEDYIIYDENNRVITIIDELPDLELYMDNPDYLP